jgi:hypothetical protein
LVETRMAFTRASSLLGPAHQNIFPSQMMSPRPTRNFARR